MYAGLLKFINSTEMVWLCFALCSSSTRLESSDGDVIHNLLHFLQVILQRIKLLSQSIVLEVEKPEAAGHIREELGDGKWTMVVTKNNTVHSQSRLE